MAASFKPCTYMIVPSMACQASCKYCFGPHRDKKMEMGVFLKCLDFIERCTPANSDLKIVFHGGEPLLAGYEWYETSLPAIVRRFGQKAHIGMQSNLWALDHEFVKLLKKYRVNIGTSIDGPEDLCDIQRGPGYFSNTWRGIRILKEYGINPGCICTFTDLSVNEYKKIFDFFADKGLTFSMHGAISSFFRGKTSHCITPEKKAALLKNMLVYYSQNIEKNRVSSLDQMVRAVYNKRADICTFAGCLGKYAAIDPDGDIYPCQRFCGNKEYAMSNVIENTDSESITQSKAYAYFSELHDETEKECDGCRHFSYCNGGCLYHIITAQKLGYQTNRDPFCFAYKENFDFIAIEMAKEMGNLLMGKTVPAPFLSMAGNRLHPYDLERNRKRILLAYEWGKTKIPENLLLSQLNKIYLNITYQCPLNCTHCSADAGYHNMDELESDAIIKTVWDAWALGFKSIVITGGEPLVHTKVKQLLKAFADIRRESHFINIVLRTSLTAELDDESYDRLGKAFSKIVISVDGDEETHDARRGSGSYMTTLTNIQKLQKTMPDAKLSLVSVLSLEERNGKAGQSVRQLAAALKISDVRFGYLRLMGRAKCLQRDDAAPSVNQSILSRPIEIKYGCGLGKSLHVEPDGYCYPCFAYLNESTKIGSIYDGLEGIIYSPEYAKYSRYTVDTNEKCKVCDVRYLCGGICKAGFETSDINSIEFDCNSVYAYYKSIVDFAESYR